MQTRNFSRSKYNSLRQQERGLPGATSLNSLKNQLANAQADLARMESLRGFAAMAPAFEKMESRVEDLKNQIAEMGN